MASYTGSVLIARAFLEGADKAPRRQAMHIVGNSLYSYGKLLATRTTQDYTNTTDDIYDDGVRVYVFITRDERNSVTTTRHMRAFWRALDEIYAPPGVYPYKWVQCGTHEHGTLWRKVHA